MKILVIGGTGFISSCLVTKLLDVGHHVTLITRGESKNEIPVHERVNGLRADRTKLLSLQAALAGRLYDAVYDMVAYEPDESAAAVQLFRGRIGRFIHCSTVSVYMVSNEVQCPITEDQDKAPLMEFFPRNPFGMQYGINKRRCEDVLWKAHDDQEFPVSMLRPTYVCGPKDPTKRDFFWIERILDGGPLILPGSGDFALQRVYVEDVARAFVSLLESPQSVGQAYNVAGEEIFSLNEYLNKLCQLLGREVEIVHIDQEVFDQLPLSSDPAGEVFPFNPRRTAVFSLEKIKRELKYRSTPFDVWMRATIEWFTERYRGHSNGYERRQEEIALANQWNQTRQQEIHES